jgi:hypothetical protein
MTSFKDRVLYAVRVSAMVTVRAKRELFPSSLVFAPPSSYPYKLSRAFLKPFLILIVSSPSIKGTLDFDQGIRALSCEWRSPPSWFPLIELDIEASAIVEPEVVGQSQLFNLAFDNLRVCRFAD